MKHVRLRPIIVEPRGQTGLGATIIGDERRPYMRPANDNRRPLKSILLKVLGRALQVLPPLVAAALIIYVLAN